jgi:hypothetical protein
MKHMDTLKNPSDAHKSKQENSARRKAQKEANAETTSHRMVKEQRAYTSKSNWNHCK